MPENLATFLTDSPFLVLDSWPIMEWLKKREPAVSIVRALIESAQKSQRLLLLSSINLGEIYYNCWNEWGEARAEEVLAHFASLPVDVIHPTQLNTIEAARIKGKYKISYADSFTAALAIDYQAPVMTGDKDFLKLSADGILTVEWIQR